MTDIKSMGLKAKKAARELGTKSSQDRNGALSRIALALRSNAEAVLAANAEDIAAAKESGLKASLIERLTLTEERVISMAEAVEKLVSLDDPIGRITGGGVRPNGLKILRTTVPLGVVGMIYESRPNVTVDAATLCLKSGNAAILRGGKETINSNRVLADIMRRALNESGLNEDAVQLIEDSDRRYVDELMNCDEYVDVLIPRGGASLINHVSRNSSVPVIATGVGNCHVYIDESADINMAVNIADNAKNSRPSVCNAAETLLVHEGIAEQFLPEFKKRVKAHNTRLMLCEKAYGLIGGGADTDRASEEDWATEYLDYILSVKIVADVFEAIEHINKYSTHHSEAIVTNDYANASLFTSLVDSAAVYVNASTRFTDGGEFGLGAEIGISTQKLHARGPMGLEALTTVKYIVEGSGQIR